MKRAAAFLALAGIALAVFLIWQYDAGAVWRAFALVGWGLLAVVCIRLGILAMCGHGWWLLVRGMTALPWRAFVQVRIVREAVNVLLPVASVGGEIVGARLITLKGLPAGLAAASGMADLLIQTACQVAFTLMGLALLAAWFDAGPVVEFALWGVSIAALGLAGFFVFQRTGAVGRVEAWLLRAAARFGAPPELGLRPALNAVWLRPGPVGGSVFWHLLAWVAGALEIWLALWCMGIDAGFGTALILESLSQALRGAAFPVPGAIGLQEAGMVVLGRLLGLEPEAALALSFVKRVPDVVIGLPALWAWHVMERN